MKKETKNMMCRLTRLVEILLFAGLFGIGYFSMSMTGLSEVSCSETNCTEGPGACIVNDCPHPPYNCFHGCSSYGPVCACGGAP